MTINDLKNYLLEFYQQHQSQLIQDYSGLNERIFIRSFQDGLDFIHQNQFTQNDIDKYLAQFLAGVPIAYIFGMSYFLEYPFHINADVLIPRFETEILVEHARDFLNKNSNAITIADIGCGPGTICLSLARMVNRPITFDAYDISLAALDVFQMNL